MTTQRDRAPTILPAPASRPRLQGSPGLQSVSLLGTGAHAPERVLTNQELEGLVDTSDEWITARTGMSERRVAAPGEVTSDLAVASARHALAASGLQAADVELVLVATVTPDRVCPPTACIVQERLGARRAMGFDVNAACSGFLNALATAHMFLASGLVGNALVIGAEVLTSITDYQDRESCILFGDGAGAVVLGSEAGGTRILDHVLGIDGAGADLIQMPAGGSLRPASHETVDARLHFLRMQGRQVFRFAVQRMCSVVEELTRRHGMTPGDLDLLIPHQANQRILEAAAHKLGMDMDKVVVNVDRFGNTSSASIPMALDEAARDGRLEGGRLVALVAFGGGLTWGASLLQA